MLTVLEPLDREALVKILTEPKNSMVRQYQQLFSLDNIELSFDQEALEAIADKAIERKTGARGLRAIIEDVLGNLMYEAPSDCTVAGIRITGACAKGEGEPEYTRDPARQAFPPANFHRPPRDAAGPAGQRVLIRCKTAWKRPPQSFCGGRFASFGGGPGVDRDGVKRGQSPMLKGGGPAQ